MKNLPISERLIISVYDYTGAWAKPYSDAGYPVLFWDKKVEGDILKYFSHFYGMIRDSGYKVHGFLFAPPCDDFALSGARWWEGKDKAPALEDDEWNGCDYSQALVSVCFQLVDMFPPAWWALENPVGRMESLMPEINEYSKSKLIFHPCDYGDPYTKRTVLWGDFNTRLVKTPVDPIMYELGGKKGSYFWAKLGGKSERTKALRSATPAGFANAFFNANR